MKAAIVSFHNTKNFGAVLQNYALQLAIRELGYEVVTIDFRNQDETASESIKYKNQKDGNLINNIIRDVFLILNAKRINMRKYRFEDFVTKNISLSKSCTSRTIGELAECYDVYICGSDQVWNRAISPTDILIYALNFVKSKPKASYAASSGSNDLTDESLLECVRKLDYVTVREQSLKDSLKKRGIRCVTVCDPTLLSDREAWLKLIEGIEPHTKGKGFLYYVDDEAGKVCSKIAQDYGKKKRICNPVPISKGVIKFHQESVFEDGPAEFLADLQATDFVVTSSFHGTVFSLLFEKEFIAVPWGKKGQRLTDLLYEVGLEDRIVYSFEDYQKRKNEFHKIDYSAVRHKIQSMRENSRNELNTICNLHRQLK